MTFNLLGKEVRGRFAFPSGVIATNSDTARWMLDTVPQIGAVVGKSTTIEPREGNREDIFDQPTRNSGWNAVGFTNPGLEATIKDFQELKQSFPKGIFFMPQIGESEPQKFAYCIKEFEKYDAADGYEVNVSCGHAVEGGIKLSQPDTLELIFSSMRKETEKPLIVKVNAGASLLEDLVKAAIAGGANAVSLINTLMGPNPEMKNKFGGFSGPPIFPVLCKILKMIRKITDVPLLAMGGIAGASDIRKLEGIDKNLFYEIGTSLAEMSSEEIKEFFMQLEIDLKQGTDKARSMTEKKKALRYRPFIIKDIVPINESLKLFRFYENLDAGTGQYVFLKTGDARINEEKKDDEYSKPFSVANDKDCLELVIRKVGAATHKIFDLSRNNVVRIKGPFGRAFSFPDDETVIYVGAGCGIAPMHHAAGHHNGTRIFILGARTAKELLYLEQFRRMGEVLASTDDGSEGFHGFVSELLYKYLKEKNPSNVSFFNCGPEIAMKKAEEIEKKYTLPEKIYHLVERMTCCGVGICGKCSIPNGKRACVDGPVFNAEEYTPGQYTRDKTGRKVFFN
jgi:dihydroorotate dehydrogenase (NAD+) catalytic subunit